MLLHADGVEQGAGGGGPARRRVGRLVARRAARQLAADRRRVVVQGQGRSMAGGNCPATASVGVGPALEVARAEHGPAGCARTSSTCVRARWPRGGTAVRRSGADEANCEMPRCPRSSETAPEGWELDGRALRMAASCCELMVSGRWCSLRCS